MFQMLNQESAQPPDRKMAIVRVGALTLGSPWCKSYCAQSSTWNQQVAARFCRVSDLHHGLLAPDT